MRVAAYVHLVRTLLSRKPTGVGKHINNMVPRLARADGINLTVLAARSELDELGKIPSDSPLGGLPVCGLPWRRWLLEASWSLARRPGVERWCGDVDWVYCPAEAFVATRRTRLAVTIHCVNWFERELWWYHHADTRKQRRGMAARFRRFAKNTDLLLPVSQFLAGRLTALFGIEPERMRVVGNGVEEEYFSAPALGEKWAKLVNGRPYLLVIGGLTRRKGGDCIIEVARELHRRKSELMVLIAGSGEPMYDRVAGELPNVQMLGYVGVDTGLPELLRSSVALLFLSVYETFGIPAVEAMAAGTPAIVANRAALPEVVGNAGVVVDPMDHVNVADVAEILFRDAALRQKHVEAGRHRAEGFHWDACVERVTRALREFSKRDV